MTAATQPDSSAVSRMGISRRSTGRIGADFMRPLSKRIEGGAFPAALRGFGTAAERDAVETAGHLRERGMGGEEQLGGADQPALLGRAYRGAGILVRGGAAIAHLDEDQRIAVAHDQIDLAVAAVPVAGDQPQAGAFEFGLCGAFPDGAERAHQGIRPSLRVSPDTGRATPLSKRAQVSSRCTRPKLSEASW